MKQTLNSGTTSQSDFLKLNMIARARALLFEGKCIGTRKCYGYIVALFSMSSIYSAEIWYNYDTKEIEKIEPADISSIQSLYQNEVQQMHLDKSLLKEQQVSQIKEIENKLRSLATNRGDNSTLDKTYSDSKKNHPAIVATNKKELSVKSRLPNGDDAWDYYTLDEALDLLGIKKANWYKNYRPHKVIPYSTYNRQTWIKKKDIVKFLEKRRISSEGK